MSSPRVVQSASWQSASWRIRKLSSNHLYWIFSATGNQCNSWRAAVTRSCGLTSRTVCAALCTTHGNGASVEANIQMSPQYIMQLSPPKLAHYDDTVSINKELILIPGGRPYTLGGWVGPSASTYSALATIMHRGACSGPGIRNYKTDNLLWYMY